MGGPRTIEGRLILGYDRGESKAGGGENAPL